MSNIYKVRDYRTVPWEQRPLAMKTLERQMGQPTEDLIRLAWQKHRNLRKVCKTLMLEDTTLRRWMKGLGLLLCANCSVNTGKLHTITVRCDQRCRKYFCEECCNPHAQEELNVLGYRIL